MATRLYFPSSGTAAASFSFDSQWENTQDGTSAPTSTTKTNTSLTDFAFVFHSSSTGQQLWRQFISDTLDSDQTIAGTFSIVVRCLENNSSNDAHLAFTVRAISPSGTVRGTLVSNMTTSTEYGTTASTRIFSGLSVSSTACLAGDRLVIEIGSHGVTPATSTTNVLRFGDPTATSDFALTANLTTDLVPWCEFSQNITFGDPAPTGMKISHFRFYKDDAALGSATPQLAEDTNATSTNALFKNTNYRIRVQSILTAAPPNNVARRLEFATALGGPYSQAQSGSGAVRMSLSSQFADGDPVVGSILTTPVGGTNYFIGEAKESSAQTSSASFSVGYWTEDVFCFKLDTSASGTYYLRVSDAGTAYGTSGLTAQVDVSTAPVYYQNHYRIYQDDAALNSATAYANEDTTYTLQKNIPFRLRIQTYNNGAGTGNISRRLEWRTGSNSWTAISTTGEVKLYDSIQFTDGTATTAKLTSPGTFVAGQGKDTGSTTTSASIAVGSYTEDVWSLIFDATALDDTAYQFRVTNAGTILDNYTVNPTVTAQAPPSFLSYGAPFLYTAANWGAVTFYLEVYFKAISGTAIARLYNETDATEVSGSRITTTTGTIAAYRTSAITLVDGKTYRIQFGHLTGDSGSFLSARIISKE